MTPAFWKNKNVFVTGHTGFKGSWLTVWLKALEANITGYSLPSPTNPSLFELANVGSDIDSIEGDIRDLDNLKSALQNKPPEILVHMAAQSIVVKSYQDPHETFTTNVIGTLHVLEAIRSLDSIKAVVIITSDKCYENKEWLWGYRESDVLGGADPYSNSKACAELVTRAYRDAYFTLSEDRSFRNVSVATVRAGNVIGGGDWAENRLVPNVIESINMNKTVIVRNPNSIRPWQHVLEPLNGYLNLAERLLVDGEKYASAWNFGPNENDTKSVSWVVEKLIKLWDKKISWEEHPQLYPHEANHLKLDSTKARQELQWAPKLNLETTLKWVVEWYKNCDNESCEELTKRQITEYQKLNIS